MTNGNLTPIVIDRHIHVPESELPTLGEARRVWADIRSEHGLPARPVDVLTTNAPKTNRNPYPTAISYMAPAVVSGVNVCAWSTAGCRAACLNTAGRGRMSPVQLARKTRTVLFTQHPEVWLRVAVGEIDRMHKRHGRIGVRLNGTSDIRWERVAPWLFDRYPHTVQWYDYTKAPKRPHAPARYALTYSVSERDTPETIHRAINHYGRIAVVVDTPAPKGNQPKIPLPNQWQGIRAIDGDKTDWRTEPGPVAILLRAKGDAIGDQSGFVHPTHT